MEKTNNSKPQLQYWMLNIMAKALQKEYDDYAERNNWTKALKYALEKDGYNAAMAAKAEIDNNPMHPLGQIFLTQKYVEDMKEFITKEATKND